MPLRSPRQLNACEAGTVTTEYVAVLVLVSLGLALATYALGPRLVGLFALQRMLLSIPMF